LPKIKSITEVWGLQRDAYKGYGGLPPLVGLHTMAEAATVGLTVAQSVARLKRLHWSLKRLHSIFVSRITSTPIYELKMAFSLHAFYCAEHVGEVADRVREMRQPPYGLEVSPDVALDLLFDEILAAPGMEPSLPTPTSSSIIPPGASAA
jgi:hypothetical protein